MKKFLIAGAVAAFAVTPALAQQAIVPGDSQQARSQVSQTAPTYQPTYRGGYGANYGGGYAMGYAPQGYVASRPPHGHAFRRALEEELDRLRVFLRLE